MQLRMGWTLRRETSESRCQEELCCKDQGLMYKRPYASESLKMF